MSSQLTLQTSSMQGKFCEGSAKNAKMGWMDKIILHLRRATLEVVNVFFNYDFLFFLIGMINKRLKVIKSVFLVYPATEEYSSAYVYSRRIPRVRWNPWPAGVLWQNGKMSLMFVVSAHNGDFKSPDNFPHMEAVVERMEHLRKLFNAERKTFAGTLPGTLFSRRMIREAPEADLTASAVVQAIKKTMINESLGDNTPIIILGGRGFIGRRVTRLLSGYNIYPIDVVDGNGRGDWPTSLDHQRVMVVNITLNNALSQYIDLFKEGTVVINEVYPEPSQQTIDQLRKGGCVCYHVVGVRAFAFPAFPAAYKGAVPCCAAWPAEKMEVAIKLL